jgi:hypothetical protein
VPKDVVEDYIAGMKEIDAMFEARNQGPTGWYVFHSFLFLNRLMPLGSPYGAAFWTPVLLVLG